ERGASRGGGGCVEKHGRAQTPPWRARRCPPIRAFAATAAMSNPLDPDSFDCLMTASRKQVFTMLPHHSRPEARVVKLINERRDDLPIRGAPGADERVAQRFAQ